MISLEKIKKVYKHRPILVQQEPITIQKGVNCVIGLNGMGKTTLLKILLGIIEPEEGNIRYENRSIAESLKKIGVMFDQAFFYPDLTGLENLQYYNAFQEEPIAHENLIELAKEWGVPLDKIKVKDYSLGMKKRLTVAFSQLSNPDFWFLDEPFNGIDSEGKQQLINKIKTEKAENKTILLISHDFNVNIKLADHLFIVHNRSMYYLKDFPMHANNLVYSSAYISLENNKGLPDTFVSKLLSYDETDSGLEITYLKRNESEIIEWFLKEKIMVKNAEDNMLAIDQLVKYMEELS
ncbi:ABC-2 type transport system ATP-binding protein [Natronobacillus azotifigens]|uniref:ABC transporter ATP-binding protein n=1 Tax=Natronobacillus azotifigens TaxID=472978 RepID=A0A9J6RBX6_9BACI|nr:ABC transporter ATP-binding protein [Natronobacillus azotifigens]MCZ0702729.1 ABC transporter ATP-binding protein [Natronobacillus azotifigens]